ncbi:carboxypeptidase-like regulatory domain-containing protein [Eisenibacter elegans]|jgi:uncharacterized protein (DUF2141 family)|uniref:carboxypeptidase-like regulatory domain-containing protein n=1 Tax=Eisenibacter elegans TaxID=997 RepID=UPI00040E6C1D|nr:carboxypeptidase-like regulatory domain-containing protein [Eisenibacter elegans]
MYKKTTAVCLLAALVLLGACNRNLREEAEMAITVLDIRGFPVVGANVTIYANEEHWATEQNPLQETALTDNSGKVSFFQLPSGTYFVDIQRDSLNNWENKREVEIIATIYGFRNEEIFVLNNSRMGSLSAASGRNWQLTDIQLAGESIKTQPGFECLRDSGLRFFKNGRYEVISGAITCPEDDNPANRQGLWRFNDQQTLLILQSQAGQVRELLLEDLSQKRLKVGQNFNGILIDIIYEQR